MSNGLVCPHCGLINHPERKTCKRCHGDLHAVLAPPSTTPLAIDERKKILEHEIRTQVSQGWVIANRTDTTAQLTLQKKPDGCMMLVLFCLGIIPGIIYIVAMSGSQNMYLEVDDFGGVKRALQS